MRKQVVDYTNYCLSVGNRCSMVYGEVTFKNVVALLTTTGLNATAHPTGISIARFAAMTVQKCREVQAISETPTLCGV